MIQLFPSAAVKSSLPPRRNLPVCSPPTKSAERLSMVQSMSVTGRRTMHHGDSFVRYIVWRSPRLESLLKLFQAVFKIRHVHCPSAELSTASQPLAHLAAAPNDQSKHSVTGDSHKCGTRACSRIKSKLVLCNIAQLARPSRIYGAGLLSSPALKLARASDE